jgi:hypothetical protein
MTSAGGRPEVTQRWIPLEEALETYRLRIGLPYNEWLPVQALVLANRSNQIWLSGQAFAIEDVGSGRMLDRAQFEKVLETVSGAEET